MFWVTLFNLWGVLHPGTDGENFILVAPEYGAIAQMGEHLPCTQGVRGSNPLSSTISAADRQAESEQRREGYGDIARRDGVLLCEAEAAREIRAYSSAG